MDGEVSRKRKLVRPSCSPRALRSPAVAERCAISCSSPASVHRDRAVTVLLGIGKEPRSSVRDRVAAENRNRGSLVHAVQVGVSNHLLTIYEGKSTRRGDFQSVIGRRASRPEVTSVLPPRLEKVSGRIASSRENRRAQIPLARRSCCINRNDEFDDVSRRKEKRAADACTGRPVKRMSWFRSSGSVVGIRESGESACETSR